jgi:hypothetical protein
MGARRLSSAILRPRTHASRHDREKERSQPSVTAVVQRRASASLEGEAFNGSPRRGMTNGCAQQAHGPRHRAPEVHGVPDYPLAAILAEWDEIEVGLNRRVATRPAASSAS